MSKAHFGLFRRFDSALFAFAEAEGVYAGFDDVEDAVCLGGGAGESHFTYFAGSKQGILVGEADGCDAAAEKVIGSGI